MNKSHVVFEVICENHLAIFFPLPYFELEAINSVLGSVQDVIPNYNKYQELTLHWIMLRQVADPYFSNSYITAFDHEIISKVAPKLNAILIGD